MSSVVALAGQPNCGKSTLFNMLTGARQHVANYPGVTVDIKKGTYKHDGISYEVVDLPGTYSLSSFSSEEMVTRDFILSSKSDVVINVLDGSNLKRSLYLTFQLLEMEVPVVLAVNMADVARNRGIELDLEKLSSSLGVKAVETVGNKRKGSQELRKAVSLGEDVALTDFFVDYGPLESSIKEIEKNLSFLTDIKLPLRWLSIKLFENDDAVVELVRSQGDVGRLVLDKVSELSRSFEKNNDDEPRSHIGFCRHLKAESVEKACSVDKSSGRASLTDRVDKVVVNRFAGPLVLVAVIYTLYELSIVQGYKATEYVVPWLNRFEAFVSSMLPDAGGFHVPLLRSLVLDVVTAANSVLIYVPIFLILFTVIAILEDVGYMPRMAFILDRLFRKFGLHGQSTLPLILGGVFVGGCAVPGVMATRVIADEKARLSTIMIVPLMNCMAKIPLYTLLLSAFFPDTAGSMMVFISSITLIIGLGVAKIFSLTIFKGKESSPFVMELPAYHLPTLRGVALRAIERTWLFLRKVGTIVVAVAVLVYFLINYPALPKDQMNIFESRADEMTRQFRSRVSGTAYADVFATDSGMEKLINYKSQYRKARFSGMSPDDLNEKFEKADASLYPLVSTKFRRDKEVRKVNSAYKRFRRSRAVLLNDYSRARIDGSWLGKAGHFFEPVTRYAGFNWKVNVALLSSLAAKESSVATLGMIYRPVEESDTDVGKNFASAESGFTPLHALALMLFMALYPPCVATLLMIKVETQSWKWATFALVYPTLLGLLCASIVFTGGSMLGLSGFQATWIFYGMALMVTFFLGTIEPSRSSEPVVNVN